MAARTRKIRHDENTRAKIKATQIVNRLQAEFLTGKHKLTQQQVRIGFGLLDKVLPSLQSTALTNPDGANLAVTHHVVMEYVKAK